MISNSTQLVSVLTLVMVILTVVNVVIMIKTRK